MLRREVVKMAGSLFGLGKPQPSRFPYPGRPQPSPGVAPSPGIVVRANTVIVSGPSGTPVGVFVYQPGTTPALGNPPIASMTAATADPFGNAVKPDIFVYGTGGNTSFVGMTPGTPAALFVGTGDVAETRAGRVDGVIFGSGPTRQIFTQHQAPRVSGENAGADAGISIASPSVDLTTNPVTVSLFAQDGLGNVSGVNVYPTKVTVAAPLIAQSGTATAPSIITTDTWNTYTLINSFTGTLNYRLCADGTVEVYGSVTTPAAGFNFTNINNAPAAAYGAFQTPAINPPILCYDNNAGAIVLAKVFGNGQIQFVNAVASHLVVFNGRYPAS